MKKFKRYALIIGLLLLTVQLQASVTVVVNGSNHTIPQTNERGWGSAVTAWIQAISTYTLQPSGGSFNLTADADFGSSYGLKAAYLSSRTSNPSTAGLLRLAKTDSIGWRNNANGANLLLGINASDKLTYETVEIPTISSTSTLTNKTLTSPIISEIVNGDAKVGLSVTTTQSSGSWGDMPALQLDASTPAAVTAAGAGLLLKNTASSQRLYVMTEDKNSATDTAGIIVSSGVNDALTGTSGFVSIETGYADGSTGDIRLTTGPSAAGTRGQVVIDARQVDASGAKITNISDPTNNNDAASKQYVDARLSDTAYDATTWNGVTAVAPSKNAVRDYLEALPALTQTLTNKTLTSPIINTPTGIVKGDVGLGNVDNTSDATKNAASVTLTNKTISGASNTLTVRAASDITGQLPIANGGTGASSKSAAFDALSPMSAGGDLIYGGASGTATRLANGSSGNVLTSQGSTNAPIWAAPAAAVPVYRSVTTTDSPTIADEILNLSGASFTVTLPTAVGNTGRVFRLIHSGTSLTQVYTLNTTSAQTIGGIASGSYVLYTNGEALVIASNGANWIILSHQAKTDWIDSGAVTITAVSANPTKATTKQVDRLLWKRDGSDVLFRLEYESDSAAGAAAGTGTYLFGLPANMPNIDTTKVTATTTTANFLYPSSVGNSSMSAGGSGYPGGTVLVHSSTLVRFATGNATSTDHIGSTFGALNSSNYTLSANYRLPILGFQP
jgi:hypothetical protein